MVSYVMIRGYTPVSHRSIEDEESLPICIAQLARRQADRQADRQAGRQLAHSIPVRSSVTVVGYHISDSRGPLRLGAMGRGWMGGSICVCALLSVCLRNIGCEIRDGR